MRSIIVFVAVLGVSVAQMMPDKSRWTPFECRDGILGPNDDRMKEVLECKPGCHFYCHAKALGLLDANGSTTEQIYDDWVDVVLPQRHRDFAKSWFSNCFRRYGTKIDASDKECAMADAYADCTWTVQSHLDCPRDAAKDLKTVGDNKPVAGYYYDN